MRRKEFQEEILPTIPEQAGVYQFYDKHDTIIYIGKAKNLKKRLSSYFRKKDSMPHKAYVMRKNAKKLNFILVDNEHDALLLESTLIKKEQPRYNVMLKDGKTYAYICIKNERFPRVFFTRRVIKDGSTYYGPYTSKYKAEVVLEFIREIFQLRTCNYNLSEENIRKGKFKVCLEYHIGNCKGICEGLETEEDYMKKIEQIKSILNGNLGPVKRYFKEEMNNAAEELRFEDAQEWKKKLLAVNDYNSKSTVVSTKIKDVDVYSIVHDDEVAFVNYMKVVEGRTVNTYTVELEKNLDVESKDLLEYAVIDLRDKTRSIGSEIIVPFPIDVTEEKVRVTVPKIGDKKHLLDLSEKNAKYFLLQKRKKALNRKKKETRAERIMKQLQKDLGMKELPDHIECFDNSNIQGSNPVASCVVFKNARPSKKDYRKFNIKTVVGPDDFSSMEEVVFRRYHRLLNEGENLPQLVIIDGGKGQLSSAMKSIRKLGLENKLHVIGIAKKLEEIFRPGDSIPLYIDKKSESLRLIQQLRNEAHRFAITFHRNQRSRKFTVSNLEYIDGIGPTTSKKLLRHFGSINSIKKAGYERVADLIGRHRASKLSPVLWNEEE